MGCGCSSTKTTCSSCNSCNCCSSCNTCNACGSCNTDCPDIAVALEVTNAWNIPACDMNAVLYIPCLTIALIGSYIYNPTYGRFKIVGFNSVNGQLTITNECLIENAAAGTVVPAGTTFIFGNPPTLTTYETWVPVVTASGAMTVSALNIDQADHFSIGTTEFFDITVRFTLGGVADLLVFISLPFTAEVVSAQVGIICSASANSVPLEDGGRWRVYELDPTKLAVFDPTPVNWTLGAGASITIQGRAQVA